MSSQTVLNTTTSTLQSEGVSTVNWSFYTPPSPPEDWTPPPPATDLFPNIDSQVYWDNFTSPPPSDGWETNLSLSMAPPSEVHLSNNYSMNWNNVTTSTWYVSRACYNTKYQAYVVTLTMLCVVGVVGNALSIAVIHYKNCTSVSNHLLKALAILDSLYLLVAICYAFMVFGANSRFMYTSMRVTQLASVGQIIILGLCRYIAICWPFRAAQICTYRNAYIAIALNVLIATGVNVPLYMHSGVPTSKAFIQIYWGLFYEIGLYYALPLILLLIFQVGLVRALWKSVRVHHHDNQQTSREAAEVTAVVITVLTVFIVSYTPTTIRYINVYFFHNTFYYSRSCATHILKFFLFTICPKINSAVNFFIYFFLRRSFRIGLKGLFHCDKNHCASRRTSQTTETVV